MRYLFLDDERIPSDVTWLNIAVVEWNIVRSFADAVAWVEANGFPDVVSFDHDLGTLPDKDSSESDTNTGHEFAKWLINHDLDNNNMPDNFSYSVHSKNNVGADNITGLLDCYIKFKNS